MYLHLSQYSVHRLLQKKINSVHCQITICIYEPREYDTWWVTIANNKSWYTRPIKFYWFKCLL